jgi:hypothetical protein
MGVLVLFGLGDCTSPSITLRSPYHEAQYHPFGVTRSAMCDCTGGDHMCRCLGVDYPIYVGDVASNPGFNFYYVSCIGSAPPGPYTTVGYLQDRCPDLRPD